MGTNCNNKKNNCDYSKCTYDELYKAALCGDEKAKAELRKRNK
jgi:hypothetical protein